MRLTYGIFQVTMLFQRVGQVRYCPLKIKRHLSRTQALKYGSQKKQDTSEREISGSVSDKFEKFDDENAPIIFDVEEERRKFYEISDETPQAPKRVPDFTGISPTRGATGVIEIRELVNILRRENATNLLVIEVPPSYSYVDYLVVATGKSKRHLTAIAEYIRKVYKFKTSSAPGIPSIEGEDSNDWKALDLGNIALHLMSEQAREMYDLDSLWSVGKEYDKLSNQKSKIMDFQSVLFSLKPAIGSISNK